MSSARPKQPERGWNDKFRDAFRGIWLAARGQLSFRIHAAFVVAVIVAAVVLRMSVIQWCVLILCMSSVLVAETFNTALEWMAKAVDHRENRRLGGALDMAGGAVLISACGAAAAGAMLFVSRVGVLLGWWSS